MPSFFMYSNHIEFSVYFILLAWTYRLLLRLLAKEFRRGLRLRHETFYGPMWVNPPTRVWNTAKILGRYIEKIRLSVACLTDVHFQNHAKLEERKCEQAFIFVLSPPLLSTFCSFSRTCLSLACLISPLGKWKLNWKAGWVSWENDSTTTLEQVQTGLHTDNWLSPRPKDRRVTRLLQEINSPN